MNEKEARDFMASVLREAAKLIEEGTIKQWKIDNQYGWDVQPDPATRFATLRRVSNGDDTVTIELKIGRLYRDRMQTWLEGPR